MAVEPSKTLRSRNYVGLILSQLLASFNDQAIHIVAIFYAGDILVRYAGLTDEKTVVSVVTASFIAPFFLFSPLAGMLADKFGKRSIIVFWKLAEVVMMALAFVGFLLPHIPSLGIIDDRTIAIWSAVLVVSTVFLMGTHSTFFVPAKFGVMPEILHPMVLSNGNGVLEGTSFVSQILGTSIGGVLYVYSKGRLSEEGQWIWGNEWVIGLVLVVLAVIGFFTSLLMEPTPPAAPQLKLPWNLWRPISANLRILLNSRPLALAVLGIAFFLFTTLFVRQSLIYKGEIDKELGRARSLAAMRDSAEARPPAEGEPTDLPVETPGSTELERAELRISMLVALVGLGVGIGSLLAGKLSGKKVELGLVPIGAVFLIIFTALLAFVIGWPWPTFICLVIIGASAGFYIVPLYTLLQHRAPKDKKGNLVATSNFVNVTGGLIAVLVFYLVTLGLEGVLGIDLTEKAVKENPALLDEYISQIQLQARLPSVLFLVASVLTVGVLVLLCRQLPDFFVRALLWLNSQGRFHLHVDGLEHFPSQGPVILATNCDHFEKCIHVLAATDRFTRFFLIERHPDQQSPLLRFLTRLTGLVVLRPGVSGEPEWRGASEAAGATIAAQDVVGLTIDAEDAQAEAERFLAGLPNRHEAVLLPVFCKVSLPERDASGRKRSLRRARVTIGAPLAATLEPQLVRAAVLELANDRSARDRSGRRKRKRK